MRGCQCLEKFSSESRTANLIFLCSEMTLSPAAGTCLRVVSDSSIRGRMQRLKRQRGPESVPTSPTEDQRRTSSVPPSSDTTRIYESSLLVSESICHKYQRGYIFTNLALPRWILWSTSHEEDECIACNTPSHHSSDKVITSSFSQPVLILCRAGGVAADWRTVYERHMAFWQVRKMVNARVQWSLQTRWGVGFGKVTNLEMPKQIRRLIVERNCAKLANGPST